MTQKSTLIFNNAGFTLLEIIAVMVIMSILAVVAVPKYFDLQSQARTKAMETAMAEAVGRVNGYFAKKVLDGELPENIIYTNETLGTDLGDFTLLVADGGKLEPDPNTGVMPPTPDCSTQTSAVRGCIYLTVTAKETTTALTGAEDRSKSIPRPGSF